MSFSVMVPAPREHAELEATLARLLISDDPPSEVLVVVGIDDDDARVAAEWAAARYPTLVQAVDEADLYDFAPEVSDLEPDLYDLEPDLYDLEPDLYDVEPERLVDRVADRVPWRHVVRPLAIAAAVVAAVVAIQSAPSGYLLYVAVSLVLGAIAWTTLVWMVHAWRTPASLSESGLGRGDLEPSLSFSLIVPARHEQAVLEATLSRLLGSQHPDFEVLVVVGTDDPETRDVAERVAGRHPDRVTVVLDSSWPKSKPKALNTALPHCTGEVTCVFDAEDDVHPALLRRVDQCFQRTDADVVQAGVQLMNFRSSWWTVRNVLEYYFWFRSRLHFQAEQGFIPLGGNTVFIRTELLQAVSGWDPDCLAEDCELGVRLSSFGAKTVVFYEPELVTREECPPTLGAFTRQRTRWNQGFLQTFTRGYWRRLPFRQRALGAYTLAMPYLMAVVWLMIPVAIVTAVAMKAPVPITLVSFVPALPMLSMLAVEVAGLGDFCRAYGERATGRDYARLVLGVLVYQSVLAFAAARAVVRELRGDRAWEKTPHLGVHIADHGAELLRPERERPASRTAARAGRSPVVAGGNVALLESDEPPPPPPPLWVDFDGVSTDGSAALRLPSRPGFGGLDRHRLGDGWAHLRSAVGSHADLVLLVALLAGVALLQATNALHWPPRQFDEGTYVSNAWAVQHGALAPYTYSYGHPPLGWLLIAVWTWARGIFADGTYSIDSGRQLMLVVTLVSCALLFTLARRLGMGRAFAAAAVLLFALSPIGLYFHRAVLLDNVAIAWALAAFVLALSPRHRLWAFAGSGACFAVSVLSKETILVVLPALIVAAVQNSDWRTRRYCLTLLGSFFGVIALSYPLYAALKGELLPGDGHVSLLGYTIHQLITRESTGSLFDPQSETHAIVSAWLALDPWLLGAALVLSPLALARRSTRAVAVAFLIQVVMVLRPGYLPNMYVIALLPFAALIVSGAGEALWRAPWLAPLRAVRWPLRACAAALVVGALVVVTPRWARIDQQAMTVQLDRPQRAAQSWLVDNVGHAKRLIVPDDIWLYLVQHGFDHHPVRGGFFSRTVVVYWPLDYDPALKKRFPDGWRDFDYIVSTEAVRSTTQLTPTSAAALEHSRVVAEFGRGPGRIEIRAIAGARRFG